MSSVSPAGVPETVGVRKIVTVIGARPQFIKASVVSQAMRTSHALAEVVVHTGQHFDSNMSEVFFADLGIKAPAYHLGISGGRHGAMTGRMLAAIEEVLVDEKPDAVLVYGDTNSTLAGALAAAKMHIPLAHVEAGLRSFNMAMPEEVNRVLSDHVSRWLYCPTANAVTNLRREGIGKDRIVHVGDVMYDVALSHGKRAEANDALTRFGIEPGAYVLVTIHRQENTDEHRRLLVIADALERTARDVPVIWPVHPRTRAVLRDLGRLDALERRIKLVDPVGYFSMIQLEKHAALVATDSGGVQKEAFFFRVPCVTLRNETEWMELVEAGWNTVMAPVDAAAVYATIRSRLGTTGADTSPYGNGDAAARIVGHLANALGATTSAVFA